MAITVPIISQFNDKGIKDANSEMAKLKTPGQKAGQAINKAFLPAVGAVGALGAVLVSGTKAAMEDQVSSEKLAGQLRRTTGATEDQVKAVEDYIAKTELASVTADTELRPAFGKLVTATKDVDEAQKLMTMSLDIAAATGKPLETVTDALAKAYAGNTTALQKLDPSLRDVIREGATFEELGQSLTSTFGGANEEFANTAEGGLARFQLQMDNAKESIGFAVMPIVEALIPALISLADFLADNTDKLIIIGGIIGGVAGTIIVLNGVMKVWSTLTKTLTILQGAFNAVMALNPIMLVVLAVVALIAIFVLLQKRFDIVGKAMDFMRDVFISAKDKVLDAFDSVLRFFRELPGNLRRVGTNILKVLTYPYRTAFNQISRLWNGTIGKFSISIPSWVPIIGGKGFSFPQMPTIPALAEGGIVNRPTLALIGEAGPEAVVPLGRGGGMMGGITINVAGSVISESDLIETVRRGLIDAQRSGRQLVA
jgi:hypothetical protein